MVLQKHSINILYFKTYLLLLERYESSLKWKPTDGLLDKEGNKRKTDKLEQFRASETEVIFAECNAVYFHSI